MHEGNKYFLEHPHYQELHLNNSGIARELSVNAGLFFIDDVLEIGCGYGRMMNAISHRVNTVTGIDLHDAPLDAAKELFWDKANLSFVKNDGYTIPFDDECFDLVYSVSSLQHMPREVVASYIRETVRVLRTRGRMFMEFLAAPVGASDIDPASVCEQSVGWTHDEIEKLFLNIGNMDRKYVGGIDGEGSIILIGVKE